MPILKEDLPYDKKSPEDILRYSKLLENTTFRKVLDDFKETHGFVDDSGKGRLGQLLEECYFYYSPNSNMEADFKEAGVELKTSPIKRLKNGKLRAKERIVLNIINYMTVIDEQWENCSLMEKNSILLLIFYLFETNLHRLDYKIIRTVLWKFSETDLEIIRLDWIHIIKKIKGGNAHELSEGDTNYLGACTKGANSKSKRKQPSSDIPAMQRAFCLKQCYVNSIISDSLDDTESVIKNVTELKDKTFEEIILSKLNIYSGMSVDDIDRKVGYKQKKSAKNHYAILAARMLGLKKNKIEEFEKGDITLKTIRLNKNGTPKESMSFPAFKYIEIVKETSWEYSKLYEQFTKRFFFMVFQKDAEGVLRFKKGMFWTMPTKDLEEAKTVWEETKKRINNDIDSFTKISENRVSHVRPHGQNKDDTYETPSGKHWTKRCFWLNARYIKEQIEIN